MRKYLNIDVPYDKLSEKSSIYLELIVQFLNHPLLEDYKHTRVLITTFDVLGDRTMNAWYCIVEFKFKFKKEVLYKSTYSGLSDKLCIESCLKEAIVFLMAYDYGNEKHIN